MRKAFSFPFGEPSWVRKVLLVNCPRFQFCTNSANPLFLWLNFSVWRLRPVAQTLKRCRISSSAKSTARKSQPFVSERTSLTVSNFLASPWMYLSWGNFFNRFSDRRPLVNFYQPKSQASLFQHISRASSTWGPISITISPFSILVSRIFCIPLPHRPKKSFYFLTR